MIDKRPSLIKLVSQLFRCTQAHTDEVLGKYQLSSGTYPFLLMLKENEGISQNRVCRELNVDKAMSARAVKRLIELEYVIKEEDMEDSRAFKLYLTEKAKAVIPEVIKELENWIEILTVGLMDEEKNAVVNTLGKVLDNAKVHRHNTKERSE